MKNLGYVLIPTGGKYNNGVRTQVALEMEFNNPHQEYIISGEGKGRSEIQGFLEGEGVSPQRIRHAPAVDSVGNLVRSFEIAGSVRVRIVSYPMHLLRFQRIFRNLKQEGNVPEGSELIGIATPYTFKDIVYSVLAEAKSFLGIQGNYKNNKAVMGIKGILDFIFPGI